MYWKPCLEIENYTWRRVMSWPELVDAAGPIRAMLGIPPSTWADAVNAIG
ncbi:replication initiation protein RepC [Methylobacterium isbiliense]